ncbi:MAG TPA: type II secretion system protein [Pseudidiomarina sp.]|nr:type II secretion system protein [Pseudidiomarina sp.]
MTNPAMQRGYLVLELLISVAVLGLFATTLLLAVQWHYQFVVERPFRVASSHPLETAWQQRLKRQYRAVRILQGADHAR